MQLPTDVMNIIHQYVHSMEHFEKMKGVLYELHMHFTIKHFSRVNLQFNNLFFPDWYVDIL